MSRHSRLASGIVAIATVCMFSACAAPPDAAVPDRIEPPAPTTTSVLPEGWWTTEEGTDTNNRLDAYDNLCTDLLDELGRAAPLVSTHTAGAMHGIDVSSCLNRDLGENMAVLNQIEPTWDQQCVTANGWTIAQHPFDGPTLAPANADSPAASAIAHCAVSVTPTVEQCASIQDGLGGRYIWASQAAVLMKLGCPDPSLVTG